MANGPRTSAVLLVALAMVATSCGDTTEVPHTHPDRPNIILLLFDDADVDTTEALPYIGAIAEGGARFSRFYANEPICCPSRASLLTGEYVHNHGVASNTDRHGGGYPTFLQRGHERRTIAATLQPLGYRTGMFGKYLNQYGPQTRSSRYVPPHWDRWMANFDYRRERFQVNDQGEVQLRSGYIDTLIVEEAERWILQTPAPFFAYISVIAPHPPYPDRYDPPSYADAFVDEVLPTADKPSFGEPDVADKPAYIRELAPLDPTTVEEIRSDYIHRLRMMRHVDDLLEGLMSELAERDALDNTYLFVTSDNGWMLGEHRLPDRKLFAYEESARLPLLVQGPGIEQGREFDELTSIVDLFATFADIAGSPERRDGRSLLPLLEGSSTPWRTRVLLENEADLPRIVPDYSGIVTDRHKYVRYATGETELYDLDEDPFEVENLAAGAPERIEQLQSWLEALLRCSGDSCRDADAS